MADLFDRFSGSAGPLSNHVADSADTWDADASTWNLTGDGCIASAGAGGNGVQAFSSWTPPGTDYAVAVVLGSGYGKGSLYGIIARGVGSSGSKSYYAALFYAPGGVPPFVVALYRVDSGGPGNLLGPNQTLSSDLRAGDTLTLAVKGGGSDQVTLIFYRNDRILYAVDDISPSRLTAAGQAGIWNGGSADTADIFNTVWAGAIGGPPPLSIAPTST
jgi:hypothetical protein